MTQMNTMQSQAATFIEQYNNGQLTLDQLEREIVELNPHGKGTPEHGWWFEDVQDMFTKMNDDKNNITIYLGNGSNSLISYLETPEA